MNKGHRNRIVWALALFSTLATAPSCGYALRRTEVKNLEAEGVHSIYIQPVTNDTYRPGVEQLLYNSLVQALAANTDLRIAGSAEGADAVMTASVAQADYVASAQTTASKIPPIDTGPANRIVPVEYRATLACRLALRRRHPGPGQREGLWSGTFSRAQIFPANVQLGVLGTTTALINDSEFDRALSNLAVLISRDAGESLRSYF